MQLWKWSFQNLTTARVNLIHDCDMITHYLQLAAMLLALVVWKKSIIELYNRLVLVCAMWSI